MDFVVGLVIILAALIITTNFLLTNQQTSTFDAVRSSALSTTELLMSTGYPQAWNQTTIINLGLLTDHKLNQTKLDAAANITYADLKTALHNPPNVYWYFANKTSVLNLGSCGYGDPDTLASVAPDCTPQTTQKNNLVSLNRFVTYNNTIIRMVVLVWD